VAYSTALLNIGKPYITANITMKRSHGDKISRRTVRFQAELAGLADSDKRKLVDVSSPMGKNSLTRASDLGYS
jgi:uncharacterized protein YqjF (DUF2071 family)